MAVNSKRKGKRGELECVKLLKSLGFEDARRTAQHSGKGGGKADVECPESLPNVHIEVKGGDCRKMPVDLGSSRWLAACHQAARDADGKPWCIIWKRTGTSQWRMTFDLDVNPTLQLRVTVGRDNDIAAALRWLEAECFVEC